MLQTAKQHIGQMMQRTGALAIAIGGSLLLTLAVFSGTASAAKSDCAAGVAKACFWMDINYGGGMNTFTGMVVGQCYNIGSVFNNQISSIYNRTNNTMQFYDGTGCQWWDPYYGLVPPQGSISDLRWYPNQNFNDRISSFKLLP